MFNTLSTGFRNIVKQLTGQGRLTQENIKHTIESIYHTLIDADVSESVAKTFIERVQEKAIGHKVISSLDPGHVLIKLVHNELINLLGTTSFHPTSLEPRPTSPVPTLKEILNLQAELPAVFLFIGPQGAGKTTTVAKLAYQLKEIEKKSILIVSTDIYRPAAILQLETLAQQIGVSFFPSYSTQHPTDIAKAAIQAARERCIDIVLIDTAGRTHTNTDMMAEIQELYHHTRPAEVLFIMDSMIGQDAVNIAQTFNGAAPLTGIILTKADSDARGGGALSIRYLIEKPIKLVGTGEIVDAVNSLEPFYPDRIASRILGMGDVISLVEKANQTISLQEKKRFARQFATQKKPLDLNDLMTCMTQIKKMGGVSGILDKLPSNLLRSTKTLPLDEKKIKQYLAMIDSMTPKERRHPDWIKHSQKKRIAQGSGTSIQAINQLLKLYESMKKMMKSLPQNKSFLKNVFPTGN